MLRISASFLDEEWEFICITSQQMSVKLRQEANIPIECVEQAYIL